MAMTYNHNYYDYERGWLGTNPGWYEITLTTKSAKHHLEIVKWLYDRIDNPERHCRWTNMSQSLTSAFKFRYERDYIWFKLTWG